MELTLRHSNHTYRPIEHRKVSERAGMSPRQYAM